MTLPRPAAPPAMPWLFRIMALIAAATAFAMMLLTACDVLARYVFNSPIRGAFELTEIFMGMMVFLAAPAMTWAGENICVTLLTERLPARYARLLQAVGDLACAGLSGLAAWQLWRHGARLLRYHEVTMELAFPKGWTAQAMAIGMGLVALAFLMRVVSGPSEGRIGGRDVV